MSDKPKRITIRSPELQQLGKDLAKLGEERRKEQAKISATRPTQYWPSESECYVWAYGHDYEEFWRGVEEWLQYHYDMKKPDVMPARPSKCKAQLHRYRYFNVLSRRYNAGDFNIQFIEI